MSSTQAPARAPLRLVIADDEAPARARMRELLGDIQHDQPTQIVGMVGNGEEALRLLGQETVDVILADIRMPQMDGVMLADRLKTLPNPPLVIFTTAYDEYALQAFEVSAIDYLMKPVRAVRLADALEKVRARLPRTSEAHDSLNGGGRRQLCVSETGRVLFVRVEDILYLKAELKYVTVFTRGREYLLDESLSQIENEFSDYFLRIHRSCLVARHAIYGVERAGFRGNLAEGAAEGNWQIILHDVKERLPISRRQWPAVRKALGL